MHLPCSASVKTLKSISKGQFIIFNFFNLRHDLCNNIKNCYYKRETNSDIDWLNFLISMRDGLLAWNDKVEKKTLNETDSFG